MRKKEWYGCNGDCFNCVYSDCMAPDTKSLKTKETDRITPKHVEFMLNNRKLSIKQLSERFGISYSVLKKFIHDHAELDAVYSNRRK